MKSVAKLNRNGPGVFFSANCLGFCSTVAQFWSLLMSRRKMHFKQKTFHLFSTFAEKICQVHIYRKYATPQSFIVNMQHPGGENCNIDYDQANLGVLHICHKNANF